MKKVGFVVIVVLAVSAAVYGLCFQGKAKDATVASHEWLYGIQLEERKSLIAESWDVPEGARVRRKWSSYDDSTASYKWRYEYEYEAWVNSRELTTKATGLATQWPKTDDVKFGTAVGCERIKCSREVYTVVLTSTDGGKLVSYRYELDRARWEKLKDKQSVIAVVSPIGSVLEIRVLEGD